MNIKKKKKKINKPTNKLNPNVKVDLCAAYVLYFTFNSSWKKS